MVGVRASTELGPSWALRLLLVACYLAATGAGGLWLILPWYTPLLYAGLFALLAVRSLRNMTALPTALPGFRRWVPIGVIGSIAALFAGLAVQILNGGRTPADVVELSFPFGEGSYLVVNGGGNELINAHYKTLKGERFRALAGTELWRRHREAERAGTPSPWHTAQGPQCVRHFRRTACMPPAMERWSRRWTASRR